MTAEAQAEGPAYAGFWRRTGAWLADQVAINGPLIAINYAVAPKAFHMRPDISPIMTPETWAMQIVWILVWIAYKGVLEGGPAGATLGKRLLAIRVTTLSGTPPGFAAAVYRAWPYWVPGLVVMLAPTSNALFLAIMLVVLVTFVLVAFTPRKQGLHDMMAKCLVVRTA
jgi:uncharacterized RDD family membrane protein YckC